MRLSGEQLEGLEEALPQGYPKQGGVIVLFERKPHSRSGRRKRRSGVRTSFIPWYQRNCWDW